MIEVNNSNTALFIEISSLNEFSNPDAYILF